MSASKVAQIWITMIWGRLGVGGSNSDIHGAENTHICFLDSWRHSESRSLVLLPVGLEDLTLARSFLQTEYFASVATGR